SGEDQDVFRGGTGTDTLVLALTEETRAAVEAELTNSRFQTLDSIGVEVRSIEEFVFVDSRDGLSDLEGSFRLDEADVWGLI
ncbi:MAG: hypothetical protein AAF245_15285, partial [Pseudomonadota bacterium]